MDIKNFVLSYYKNSTENFHIHKFDKTYEALKPHKHVYFQIYFILKGALTHFVGNESSRLTHGDMFIVPPDRTHYISLEPDTVFYSFSFMPDFLKDQDAKLANSFLKSSI